ncbi:exodeoxyribonuclease VII small subunit [Tenuibacillus multivorans]|uniref:Exodeoxyribonuclease 7 small subunit n=1 Tax=Tenuibacillus multivorans TaxID=237069 RepID=A0A1G9Z708_9BACI|nr:exodeoxyribonuclease VII small subunit [Tenuibacillus multivorans]GEL77374.1 exodeoxyribonuclease 7 small subunit [Tenuibacillus multivorans]SDN17084.1 exodeoxyribonuclease VII small subunit [Tenuibacillus multivorans]
MANQEELTFEQAMKNLEDIVDKLEEGDVPLEKAIEYYKEGMKLSKFCNDKLKSVEDEITEIMNENGETESYIVEEE